ncbi:aspartyl-phosphate phosphatase Spo0E family protein [Peribacillus frigoritolerans]|uniref:aspartyl-phosphate phosphatase Spo0E family protein n=1 Tax=Peribacillus frigoritolerans TaxID=450367 RepID=UPI0021A9BB75|nr:aspartyl-phosphate phosphatase Spo0E family protein [Peribacillus frigoritolerans]MCT4477336.1 aspartyl-phosphate phosphatase Spo0E family protein [Peribacillus frigoritolerans]
MEALYEKIEILRKELITTGLIYGFTAPKTLHKSQELDKLLNLLGVQKEPIELEYV